MEALSTDKLHGGKSTDRKHPQKLNIEGVLGNLFIKAAARVERKKKKMMRQKQIGEDRKGMVCSDLTCLGDRPVETVMGSLRSPL